MTQVADGLLNKPSLFKRMALRWVSVKHGFNHLRFRPKTLAGFLNFYLGLGLVVMTLSLSVAGYYFISHILHNALLQKGEAIAEQVATTTIDAILLNEYSLIERMVNDMVAKNADLQAIRIENSQHQVLAEVEQVLASKTAQKQPSLVIIKPLIFFKNPAGTVILTLSNESVITPLRQLSLLVALALLVMLTALFFAVRQLLSNHVITPISQLCAQLSSPQKVFYETLSFKDDLPAELALLNQTMFDLQRDLQAHIQSLKTAHQFTEQATQTLCQNQRLATVGQLAAGLAHNLNTPLANIIGYAQMAKTQTQEPQMQTRLTVIERQAKSCSAQVKNLLQAAKPPSLSLQMVNLVSLTHKVLEMIRPLAEQHAAAHFEFEHPDEAMSLLDIATFEHILFNLINNAIEAQATQITLLLSRQTQNTAEFWQLQVCDNGSGVPEALQTQIFSAFVSSKPAGLKNNSGTGLGLFLAQTLLRQMQGDIHLSHSQPGQTCFALNLPASHS